MTLRKFVLCVALMTFIGNAHAQSTSSEERIVLSLDSAMWNAYNTCDVDAMKAFFTDDLEFYHDMGGYTKGVEDFISKTRTNLCGNDNFRLRREVVPGTVKVYLMKNDNKPYGAILTGQHVFYIIKDGKAPRLDGLARFTHLLVATGEGWKMSRILSYDHGPAPYVNQRKATTLQKSDLNRLVGKYQGPNAGTCAVTRADNALNLAIGDKTYRLIPESKTVFFQQERDVTFEFTGEKMIVREFGDIVEEAVRSKN